MLSRINFFKIIPSFLYFIDLSTSFPIHPRFMSKKTYEKLCEGPKILEKQSVSLSLLQFHYLNTSDLVITTLEFKF